jgi:hypothetical protein
MKMLYITVTLTCFVLGLYLGAYFMLFFLLGK